MTSIKKFFQAISYLQYPLMGVALFFCYRPMFNGLENIIADFNIGFIFMGIGVSFSTMQDTTKTQNKLSLRVYQNPKKTRIFLTLLGVMAAFFLLVGMVGLLSAKIAVLQELAFGLISIGIGMMGMLKTASEMAEYHQVKA